MLSKLDLSKMNFSLFILGHGYHKKKPNIKKKPKNLAPATKKIPLTKGWALKKNIK